MSFTTTELRKKTSLGGHEWIQYTLVAQHIVHDILWKCFSPKKCRCCCCCPDDIPGVLLIKILRKMRLATRHRVKVVESSRQRCFHYYFIFLLFSWLILTVKTKSSQKINGIFVPVQCYNIVVVPPHDWWWSGREAFAVAAKMSADQLLESPLYLWCSHLKSYPIV